MSEKVDTSNVTKEKLKHGLLGKLGQSDPSKPNQIVSSILEKLTNLNLFIPVEGTHEAGDFPRKSCELLGLAAYNLILNNHYDAVVGSDSEFDIGGLDRTEWYLLQAVLKQLS